MNNLTCEEQKTLLKLENYFKCSDMSIHDKVFNALIIAEHELTDHCFANEHERLKVQQFKLILNSLLDKIYV
ncbi:MAG: hypothetical protein GX808_09435 [Syntrophomonadaceae bacterium]|jgi:hypothetical protein|nr:hypothetical protein [Syntrophomonadaceae bacterium]